MNWRKILKRFFSLVGIIIAVMLVRFIFDGYYYDYDYHDMEFSKNKPSFFNAEALNDIRPEYSYGDRFGDTVFHYKYKQSDEILIWELQKYNPISIQRIVIDNNFKNVSEKDYGTGTQYTSLASKNGSYFLALRTKVKKAFNLKIDFGVGTTIDTTLRNKNFIYYSLDFGQISTYDSDGLDILVSKLPTHSNPNFMLYKYNGIFYLMLLYAKDDSEVKKDMLLNLVNLND